MQKRETKNQLLFIGVLSCPKRNRPAREVNRRVVVKREHTPIGSGSVADEIDIRESKVRGMVEVPVPGSNRSFDSARKGETHLDHAKKPEQLQSASGSCQDKEFHYSAFQIHHSQDPDHPINPVKIRLLHRSQSRPPAKLFSFLQICIFVPKPLLPSLYKAFVAVKTPIFDLHFIRTVRSRFFRSVL